MKEKTADEVILTPMYEGEVYKYQRQGPAHQGAEERGEKRR